LAIGVQVPALETAFLCPLNVNLVLRSSQRFFLDRNCNVSLSFELTIS
jgi:hypothetical protein